MLSRSRRHSREGIHSDAAAAPRVLNGNSSQRGFITCAEPVKRNCGATVKRCSVKSKVILCAFSLAAQENVNYCFSERWRVELGGWEWSWSACVVLTALATEERIFWGGGV